MNIFCTDGEYNDILEDLDILYENHNPHNLENENELEELSNLIVDMSLNGAMREEIETVVKYSMDVIDKNDISSSNLETIENLRNKYKSRETLLYDQVEHIKGRVIDLLNERLDLGQKLNEEKHKVKKLQIMIGLLVNKLGKDVVYDALGIHEEKNDADRTGE